MKVSDENIDEVVKKIKAVIGKRKLVEHILYS